MLTVTSLTGCAGYGDEYTPDAFYRPREPSRSRAVFLWATTAIFLYLDVI